MTSRGWKIKRKSIMSTSVTEFQLGVKFTEKICSSVEKR
jgi:hypothetical protein